MPDRPAASAERPLSGRACALGCGVWLLVMALPLAAFWLATQREVAWARGPGDLVVDKLFVVNEPEAGGLAYQAGRLARDDSATGGPVCVRVTVTYVLWRNTQGGAQDAAYCQCYQRGPDGGWTTGPAQCPTP